MELFDNLNEVKNALFDAPDDIKSDFNNIVKYFDKTKPLDTPLKELVESTDIITGFRPTQLAFGGYKLMRLYDPRDIQGSKYVARWGNVTPIYFLTDKKTPLVVYELTDRDRQVLAELISYDLRKMGLMKSAATRKQLDSKTWVNRFLNKIVKVKPKGEHKVDINDY